MEYTLDVDTFVNTYGLSKKNSTTRDINIKLKKIISEISSDETTKRLICNSDVATHLCKIYNIDVSSNEIKSIRRTEIIDKITGKSSLEVNRYKVCNLSKYELIVDHSIDKNKIVFENEKNVVINFLDIIDNKRIIL